MFLCLVCVACLNKSRLPFQNVAFRAVWGGLCHLKLALVFNYSRSLRKTIARGSILD